MNLFTRAAQLIMLAMVAALTIAIIGCDGGGGQDPQAGSPVGGVTPTVTPGDGDTTEPPPQEASCAAESTDRFVDAQDQVSWTVYCPSYLPEGFQLEDLQLYFPEVAGDGGQPPSEESRGSVEATFVNQQGASVGLYQGNVAASIPGVDLVPRLAAGEGISPETTAFGELDGTLYAPLTTIQDVNLAAYVVVVPSEGPPPSYVLQTSEVDVDAVRQIAAGMRPVDKPAAPPETGGMDGFRTFAQQVEQAIVKGDAQFFIDRARITEHTCPVEPGEVGDPRCIGEPGGTVIEGVFAGPAQPVLLTLDGLREDLGGYLDSLADPTLYAIGDESSWASEPNTLANYYGFENAFYAVVTSSDDPPNTTRVLTFEFPSEEGRWLLALVRTTGSPVEAEDWLSGDYTEWYDHWERWEGIP